MTQSPFVHDEVQSGAQLYVLSAPHRNPFALIMPSLLLAGIGAYHSQHIYFDWYPSFYLFVCLFVCLFYRTFPFLYPCSECTLYPPFLSLTLSVILFISPTFDLVPICSQPTYLPFTHLLLSSILRSQTTTLSPSFIFLSYPP